MKRRNDNRTGKKPHKKARQRHSLSTSNATAPSPPVDLKPRSYTVSLALPGSIIANAQSAELKSYLAGQIARAVTVFNVDEVVVFSEDGSQQSIEGELKGVRTSNPNVFLARVLQYLETPQYLRKHLFPLHHDLRFAGLLNPIVPPHHMNAERHRSCSYREGVVVKEKSFKPAADECLVYAGLQRLVKIHPRLKPGVRVTVELDQDPTCMDKRKFFTGKAVAPSAPREKYGYYWGYNVRMAAGLSQVITECPFEGGYDLTVGTSERGENAQGPGFKLPNFKHLLVVFGGVGGLEDCVVGDERLTVSDPGKMFDKYLNVCDRQGSDTIRTEEAVLIAMSVLHPLIQAN